MTIAALLVFSALLTAWLTVPAERRLRADADLRQVAEPLADLAEARAAWG